MLALPFPGGPGIGQMPRKARTTEGKEKKKKNYYIFSSQFEFRTD